MVQLHAIEFQSEFYCKQDMSIAFPAFSWFFCNRKSKMLIWKNEKAHMTVPVRIDILIQKLSIYIT